ncbi:hypothetical protein H4S07_002692 [Coemansia furcata]|uniref:Uncharacterized protein n=1 Tax=Coemansia furcata TaxID=417177 RepID=A0ACC1LJQ2_9FUNG|nr:hypothetical protein H4S07_002692 [Coemansia furcata]
MLKTAGICHMLLIEHLLTPDKDLALLPLAQGLYVIYPDILSPELANVCRMHFCHCIPTTKVKSIKCEVLQLLEEGIPAVTVKLEAIDIEQQPGKASQGAMPSIDLMSPVAINDPNTPMVTDDDDGASSIAIDDLEFDENPAGKLEQGLEELEGKDECDEEEEEGDDDEESDLDLDMGNQQNNERALQMCLLEEEIAKFERTIRKKCADLDSAPNPIIRHHLEDMIQCLKQELNAKCQELEHYAQVVADEEHQIDTPN